MNAEALKQLAKDLEKFLKDRWKKVGTKDNVVPSETSLNLFLVNWYLDYLLIRKKKS